MELPKISIVIPSYNKADFIKRTLDSIFNQKYPNLEVIIQDGGSTDGTLQVIKKYAAKYSNKIIWESKPDNSQVDAIEKGMKKATGYILTYINADDIYHKNTLRIVAETFSKNPRALWVAGQGMTINSRGKEIGKIVTAYKNFLLRLNSYFTMLSVNYLMQPSVFFLKKTYEEYGPFIGTDDYVLEYDLWLKLGKVCMPIVVKKNLSSFRISQTNISSTLYKDLLANDYELVKEYTKNPIILLLHKMNNFARVVVINLLK